MRQGKVACRCVRARCGCCCCQPRLPPGLQVELPGRKGGVQVGAYRLTRAGHALRWAGKSTVWIRWCVAGWAEADGCGRDCKCN